MKIFKGLSNSKKNGFQCEKAFKHWCGPDATAERTDTSGMSGKSSGFTSPKANFRRQTCKRWHLPRAFETACGPPRPKDVAWQKIRLFADSASVYTAKTTQRLLAEFRFLPGGLAAILAKLESARLRHQACFAGKSPSYDSLKSYRPTSVHRRRIGPESGVKNLQIIGFCRGMCQHWHLPRAFETAWGPLGPEGRSLTENTPSGVN